jgi:hypothetical protein
MVLAGGASRIVITGRVPIRGANIWEFAALDESTRNVNGPVSAGVPARRPAELKPRAGGRALGVDRV